MFNDYISRKEFSRLSRDRHVKTRQKSKAQWSVADDIDHELPGFCEVAGPQTPYRAVLIVGLDVSGSS